MAGVAELVSAGLAIGGGAILDPVPRYVGGWALASLLGFALVVVYRRETERRRYEDPSFADRPAQQRAATVVLTVGVVLVAVHSWGLATHLAS